MNWFGLLFVFGGLFAGAGAVLDWDWFMNSRKARALVGLLGRQGARVFYCLLGLGLAVFGTLILLGVIQPDSQS